MDSDAKDAVQIAFENIAGSLAEARRQAHPSHGGAIAFPHLEECLDTESRRLRGVGLDELALALGVLRGEEGDGQ